MSTDTPTLEGIAIVGMSGRFPGATNVREFWRNLLRGEESISTIAEPASAGDGLHVPRRGLLEKPEWFDAAFFGISPREAEVIDPQQRVFLEECWNALEDAACDPTRYGGAIGVYAGMSNNTYWAKNVVHHPELIESVGWLTAMMGNEKDYLATRAAYKLNLRGPALSIYTACSTSLVAVCQAAQGLLNYACDVALAGGISITFPHERGYAFDDGGILSPDGHCRAFDASAAGTVFSNGVGLVVLKRLADAVADRDHIYAVVKGAALNNDGSNKVSFTAPSVEGHAEVIALAHALAGFEPRSIGYVEAHGTGTPLGDPIEIAGLTQAFRAGTDERGFCAIGSVKTNIGHLDAAAGIAGLIKTALILKHGKIPASLHFSAPNPALQLDESPFQVSAQMRDWPASPEPRRAGVSSFGVGGTNAHVVLEEAPAPVSQIADADAGDSSAPRVLLLSAKTEEALRRRASDLADCLQNDPELRLDDVCFTLRSGRAEFAHRHAVVASNRDGAIAALRGLEPRRAFSGSAGTGGVVFMFPGQGAQYPGMGARLYAQEPAFRQAFDECCAIAGEALDLRAIFRADGDPSTAEALRQTRLTQPAIFSVSYALAKLWMARGVQPAAFIGHSVGEYVAAVLAGVFSLRDGLELVIARARLVQEQPAGRMLAARLSEEEVSRHLRPGVSLAAVNGPKLVVLAGPDAALAEIETALATEGVAAKSLETSRAFHSEMMDPVVGPLTELASKVERHAPQFPIMSTVSGAWLREEEATDPAYWGRHARATVRFAPAVAELLKSEHVVFLECGPGQTLSQLARQHQAPGKLIVSSIHQAADEPTSVTCVVAQLWTRDVALDWSASPLRADARRVPLPGYAFDRKRFFADAPAAATVTATPAPLTAKVEDAPAQIDTGALVAPEAAAASAPAAETQSSADRVSSLLVEELQRLSGLDLRNADLATSFIELGLDSLFLTQLAVAVQKRFGVRVTFRQLLQDVTSPATLASFLAEKNPTLRETPAVQKSATPPVVPSKPAPRAHGPFRGIDATSGALTPAQREHINRLTAAYSARTARSKEYATRHRAHLADPRAVAGFRREWKEMIYPLVCDRSEGARLWDADGNEYIDITLGFGQILFGHRPSFLIEALEQQLRRGIEIGPTNPLAGELAERLSRFLQLDRVAFCNTGSEAVAAALRLSRTVTGRDRVVVFNGAYHGIFDEVLFRPGPAPIAPGIPQSAVENLVVLDYGTDEALNWLREHCADIAAVMVEPVQSRHPALAPGEFLKELRAITAQHGTALVFDEIVTGFRVAPRGAQEHFGIKADLATYGKVIGGGMPIGIIAGSRAFMDALDGGAWNYGDDSFPEVGVTFFAGTFVRHPLALAAANAILRELESAGPNLQNGLAARAADLAGRMNAHLDARQVPLRWEQFSSMYHLPIPPDARHAALIFAHMRLEGIHAWENRPCFLSAAHTETDIERVFAAFQRAVDTLVAAQLLPGTLEAAVASPRAIEPLAASETPEFAPAEQSAPAIDEADFNAIATAEMAAAEQLVPEMVGAPSEPAMPPEVADVPEQPIPAEPSQAIALSEPAVPSLEIESPAGTEAVASEEPASPAISTPPSAPAEPVHCPVTEAQQEILLAACLSEDANCAFNDAISLRIEGPLDLAVFEASLCSLITRHQALRSSFTEDLRELVIHPVVESGLETRDLRALPAEEQQRELAAVFERDALQPFHLQNAPLWRAVLFQLGPELHEFRFTAHHAICDGWSFGLIASELSAIYTAGLNGTVPDLSPAISWEEHANAQHAGEASDEFVAAEQWWIEHLTPPPPFLELPIDEVRAPHRAFRSGTISSRIPREIVDGLRRVASQQKTTLYAVLLAGFGALLQRLSGQGSAVIGVASAGQATAGGPLVGHCVSFLPLHLALSDTAPFREAARDANILLLDATDHSAVTFGRILQSLKIPREPGRMPLTGVSFNVDRAPAALSFGNARAEFQPMPKERYHLELSLNLLEQNGAFEVFCHFNRQLFADGTIQRWLGHFVTLLDAAAANADTCIAELPLLSAEDRERMLDVWNDTARPYPRDLGIDTLFEEVAARQPEEVAVLDGRRAITYGELDFQANILANRLLESGQTPGALVGICLDRGIDLITACLATLKAGCAYVPLDPSWPGERLAFMARDAGLTTVVTRLEHARHFGANTTLLDGPKPPVPQSAANPNVATNGDTLAYVIYTSGSTGIPKGVAVLHRSIARLVINTDYVQLTKADVVGHASNPAFDAATFEIWGALLNGARMAILPKATMLHSPALGPALQETGVTALFVTTGLFNQVARLAPGAFQSVKTLLFGGDAASARAVARVWKAGRPQRLVNIYGPTEVTTFACAHPIAAPPAEAEVLPIGRPIANTTAYILDDLLRLAPIGVPGELYLGGDGVAAGYHNQAGLTAERFVPSPFKSGERLYRTGDRAKWTADGRIVFLGRLDGQIKLRGFRVELGEIEAELLRHPEVREAAARVFGAGAEEKSLAAYFVPKNGNVPDQEELRAFLRRRLPEHMVPASITKLEALPLNANGKIDRAALPQSRAVAMIPVAPLNTLEAKVAGLMATTLGQPNVSATDDFFRLGGHSLLAMDLMARLRKTFGVEVPPSVLFEIPNARGLAAFIAKHQPAPETDTKFQFLIPIQRGKPGRKPLFLVAGGWGGEIEFLVYAQIGRMLDPDQPIWGLKAKGAGTGEPPHASVSAMAADYLKEVRRLQPVGPYWLAGECVGGICAHEMACQLRESGESVGELILLDTSVPSADELADYLAQENAKNAKEQTAITLGSRIRHHWGKMKPLSFGKKVGYLMSKKARAATNAPAEPIAPHPRGQAQYPPTLMRHRLRPYPGRVTLLIDAESSHLYGQLGWENASIGELVLHVLPGDHISYIREEGAHAAQKLREILSERMHAL